MNYLRGVFEKNSETYPTLESLKNRLKYDWNPLTYSSLSHFQISMRRYVHNNEPFPKELEQFIIKWNSLD